MSGEIGMSDASHRRVFSTETYSTRSITLDDDSHSEKGPFVKDDGKEAENSSVIRLSVRTNKYHYDVLTFNDGGGNGDDDDDDSINSEDDFEDNDFDALVGEFFWFLRNKENDRTPIKSPRTPRSGGILTPRRGTSVMSPSSKGSHRPLVYRDTEAALTPQVTPKAGGRPYESVPIQVISVSEFIETETASSAPVSPKASEHGDGNVSQETTFLSDVVENETSPYIPVSLNETHRREKNVAGEASVFSYNIDNDRTSKASALSKGNEHDDVIVPTEIEPRLDNVDTDETTSVSSKHLSDDNIEKEAREENVPDEASFSSDDVDSDGTSKASVSLEGIEHDDVVVSNEVESRFDNVDTKKTSSVSSKESIHDDEKRQLIEDTQMNFVVQPIVRNNDPHIKAYEKWVKKGLMPKMPLIEGEQEDYVLRPIVQENDQQSKAYAVWERKGMMSPERTPNKAATTSSTMTENHQQSKEKGLMSPELTPNSADKERAPVMKENDQQLKEKGPISHEPTSSKAERSARVASLITRSKKLLGKETNVASSDKQTEPDGCLQDAPVMDLVSTSDDPSPESDDAKEPSEALATSSTSLRERKPNGTYSTLPQKSAAPGERRVSFDAKFFLSLDTGEESVISAFSMSPSPKNSSGTKPLFAFADMPSEPSIAHSTDAATEMESRISLIAPISNSASPRNPRITFDSDCENKSRCSFDAVPAGLTSGTEPRVTFDALPTDSYSSNEPSISFDTMSTESASEEEPRSSPSTPPPNSASPRKQSITLDPTAASPLCKFDTLLTAFDSLLIKRSDRVEPRIVSDAPSSDSMNEKEQTILCEHTEPTPTRESPSSTIDSPPAGLTSVTEPRVTFDALPTYSYSSNEPSLSFDTMSTESASEEEPRSSSSTPPPNSASPRKHSIMLDPTAASPQCKFDTLLTAFDTRLIKSTDRMEPRIIFDAPSSDSMNGKEPSILREDTEPTTTSEPPSSTIDSPFAADPDGVIFDVPSTDSVNGKEPSRIFDDVVPDSTSALEQNSTNAFLIESPGDAEPTGSILDARSPDSAVGKGPRPIFEDVAQGATSAPESNGATTFLIKSPSNAEPAGIIFDAPSPDSTNGKESRHICDDVAPDPTSASDPNGNTTFLYKSPSDAEPAGIIYYAPSPDFANGKEPRPIIDDVASGGDAEPTGCIFETPSPDSADGKEPKLIFNDTIRDATGASEPSDMIATLPCKTGITTGPNSSLGVLPSDSSSGTLGTLVVESASDAEPSSKQSAPPPDSSITEESNDMIATLAIESTCDADSSCTLATTPADSVEELTSSSATLSIKSTDSRETSSSVIPSTDSAIIVKGPSSTVVTVPVYSATGTTLSNPSIINSVEEQRSVTKPPPSPSTHSAISAKEPSRTVVTVLVYSATGTRISSNSITGVEEQRSVTKPPPSAPVSGRIIYSPTATGRRSRSLIIPHMKIPSSISIAPQIEPGLVAKRSIAFDSPQPKAMSARDSGGTLGASPRRLNFPSRLNNMENPSSISIAPPTKPNSAEKRRSTSDSAQSEALSGREPSGTLGASPRGLNIPPHLTNREKPSNISIASLTSDSLEKRSCAFDSPRPEPMSGIESSGALGSIPVSGRKQSNATSANSTGEEDSNLFTSPPTPFVQQSSGNFSSILSRWKVKSEHNLNGHFLMSPIKDVTSPRTPSKTPPTRIWSPPGKSRSTTPSRALSKDFSARTWTPSQTTTAGAPCAVTSPARSLTSSQSRTAEVPIAVSSPTHSFAPSQSDELNVMPSAVSSITTNQSKRDNKQAAVGSPAFSKAPMPRQSRTDNIPSVIIAPTPSKALSQAKTEDIPNVSSRAWTPSRHKKCMEQSSEVTNEPCSCSCESSSPFSGNDQLVEFFLPKLGMAHTCGKRDPPILIDSDPIALNHILRPWQVEFLKSVDIYRGDQLVKECNARAGTLAGAMRKWRLQNNLSSPKTISCGMALHIWSRTCKYYVRSIRRQMADGLVEVEPPTLSEVMSSFLDKDNGVSVPVETRMSLLTMGEPDSQREM
jgi:hypothetical protein